MASVSAGSSRGLSRIASYNIRKAVGLDWRRDPARILRVADDTRADIIALQEADRRLGPRASAIPRALLDASGWRPVVLGDGVSLGWHGNAILLGSEARLISMHGIDLPGLEPRGALLAEIETRGRPLTVVALHLGLLRRHRRLQLASITDRLKGTLGPVVLAGDFNEWSATRGLEPLAGTFDVHTPGHSFHAARPIAGLDRIAVGTGAIVRSGGVVETAEARRASDHLPIYADIHH